MCLYYCEGTKKQFLAKHTDKKEITVWKVWLIEKKDVFSIIYESNKIKPGWIKSNRTSVNSDGLDKTCWLGHSISRGIHVHLTRESARDNRDWGGRVFKCKALLSDLVEVGNALSSNQAVFMKIHISKKDFERGKKGRN